MAADAGGSLSESPTRTDSQNHEAAFQQESKIRMVRRNINQGLLNPNEDMRMVSFKTIKDGDVLWDCHKVKQGNTHIRKMACYQVKVISVDPEKGTALCSWNSNSPRTYFPRQLAKLRRSKI